MQCTIPRQHVKFLVRGLHSLSKIGEDLYIEPTQYGLNFRTVNTAQSAYSSLVFNNQFFSTYSFDLASEDEGKCKITMKACLSVFKTPNCLDRHVEFCKVEIDRQCDKLRFEVQFSQGYTKNYLLHVCENETVQLQYNKEGMCNKVCILSKLLNSSLKHFRMNDEEITFDVNLDKIHLRNYYEHASVDNQKLVRTSISLRRTEFEMYDVSQPCSITFTLRELRAVCAFSESSNALVSIFFEAAGKPVIFTIQNNILYEADYVISTLPPEMMGSARPQNTNVLSSATSSSIPSVSGINITKNTQRRSSTNTTRNSQRKRMLMPVDEQINELLSPAPSRENPMETDEPPESCEERVPEMPCLRRAALSSNESSVETNFRQVVVQAEIHTVPQSRKQASTITESSSSESKKEDLFAQNGDMEDDMLLGIDLNNEHFQIHTQNSEEEKQDQNRELNRSQIERIEHVFKYCFDFDPDRIPDSDSEVLCEDTDTEC